jgi:hypothetical protein
LPALERSRVTLTLSGSYKLRRQAAHVCIHARARLWRLLGGRKLSTRENSQTHHSLTPSHGYSPDRTLVREKAGLDPAGEAGSSGQGARNTSNSGDLYRIGQLKSVEGIPFSGQLLRPLLGRCGRCRQPHGRGRVGGNRPFAFCVAFCPALTNRGSAWVLSKAPWSDMAGL